MSSFSIKKSKPASPSAEIKNTPSVVSSGVVSVIPRPITKSDWSTSETLNLAEKNALLLVDNLNYFPELGVHL